jgi:serine/threonine protein kinase
MNQFEEAPHVRRAHARVGQVLRGKWRLDRLLGVGGMAAVYAATHRNGKRGAVKMLHLEAASDAEAHRRFLREGYVANKVEHPGAVSVLDDDIAEDGSVFIVMELLEGETADARAERSPGGRLDVRQVVAIAYKLLDVIAAAHDKGVIHRDLKPENVFLTQDGDVKVLDFGIARLREPTGHGHATQTGNLMGTPAFMPPEQALGNWPSVDARSDVWAVGATMFSLLSGRNVHEAENIQKLLLAAMTKPPRSVLAVAPDVPPAVAAVVDRALAFDQKDRFQSARAMQEALRDAAKSAGGPSRPSITLIPPRPGEIVPSATAHTVHGITGSRALSARGRLFAGLGAAVALFAIGGVLLFVMGGSPPAELPPVQTTAPSAAVLPELAPTIPAAEVKPTAPSVSAAMSSPEPSAEAAAPTASAKTSSPPSAGRPATTRPAGPKPSGTTTAKPKTTADPLGKW